MFTYLYLQQISPVAQIIQSNIPPTMSPIHVAPQPEVSMMSVVVAVAGELGGEPVYSKKAITTKMCISIPLSTRKKLVR